jgi:hypothetical protein
MEVACIRCISVHEISLPPEFLQNVNSEDLAGDAMIQFVAEELGWAIKLVKRRGEVMAVYSVCPVCVEKDFVNYLKNR